MTLPGNAAIPAPYRERGQMAFETGKRIVEMVADDLTPSKIMTRESFENAIAVNTAIGGSTNAPNHLNGIAALLDIKLEVKDWEKHGHDLPLLVNMQPAGEYLGEDYHRAGGVPAVVAELMSAGKIHEKALTVNGKSIGENCKDKFSWNRKVIREYKNPIMKNAGFKMLHGNLFDSAIMKTSVISEEFRKRYLSNPKDLNAFEAKAIVFDGPEDYHTNIDDPKLAVDENTILFIRGVGPLGYPGAAEVVNMRAPNYLLEKGIRSLPCVGDGRQSGTSGSPSILNASPEAAAGGGLAILKNGDMVRIDLNTGDCNVLISTEEINKRKAELEKSGGYKIPPAQTPWQEIYRNTTEQLAQGMIIKGSTKFQRVAKTMGIPRDNH